MFSLRTSSDVEGNIGPVLTQLFTLLLSIKDDDIEYESVSSMEAIDEPFTGLGLCTWAYAHGPMVCTDSIISVLKEH